VQGIKVVPQGRRIISDNLHERIDPRGRPYYWIGPMRDKKPPPPGTDLSAIEENWVTVTPIFLDFTHVPALKELKKVFS
jgi:5'-nucleotidase